MDNNIDINKEEGNLHDMFGMTKERVMELGNILYDKNFTPQKAIKAMVDECETIEEVAYMCFMIGGYVEMTRKENQ